MPKQKKSYNKKLNRCDEAKTPFSIIVKLTQKENSKGNPKGNPKGNMSKEILEQKDFPIFSDLGRELAADTKGNARDNLLNKINTALSAKEKAIESGLAPNEKIKADAELEALKAATRIISLFWHVAHKEKEA